MGLKENHANNRKSTYQSNSCLTWELKILLKIRPTVSGIDQDVNVEKCKFWVTSRL